jgi:hypothetical protein
MRKCWVSGIDPVANQEKPAWQLRVFRFGRHGYDNGSVASVHPPCVANASTGDVEARECRFLHCQQNVRLMAGSVNLGDGGDALRERSLIDIEADLRRWYKRDVRTGLSRSRR